MPHLPLSANHAVVPSGLTADARRTGLKIDFRDFSVKPFCGRRRRRAGICRDGLLRYSGRRTIELDFSDPCRLKGRKPTAVGTILSRLLACGTRHTRDEGLGGNAGSSLCSQSDHGLERRKSSGARPIAMRSWCPCPSLPWFGPFYLGRHLTN